MNTKSPLTLKVGWASCDITPPVLPVLIAGQFHARLSEGVDDPLTATALVLATAQDQVIFVSCDLVAVSDAVKDAVRHKLAGFCHDLQPDKIIFHATHTHAAPELREKPLHGHSTSTREPGVELQAAPAADYIEFLTTRLAACISDAWKARKPGKVAYGYDFAVVGRNRRWVDQNGVSTMYGLMNSEQARARFRHIEGYEDHSLNLLGTYDMDGTLTGLLINIPSPSQESEHAYRLSADFWCETRQELKRRLHDDVFILPQCSAAGDLTSHLIFDVAAQERMLELRKHSARRDIACRIADAVEQILPAIGATADSEWVLKHSVSQLELPANQITQEHVDEAKIQAEALRQIYAAELAKLEETPALRDQPRWYVPATRAYRRMNWFLKVAERYEDQCAGRSLTHDVEVHVVRLGDIAFASNPFEYYLDFGIQIKVRSPYVQTFLIQLAGEGTYVPSPRSVRGGGYGSVPASNPIGPEGGQKLADHTVAALDTLLEIDFPAKQRPPD